MGDEFLNFDDSTSAMGTKVDTMSPRRKLIIILSAILLLTLVLVLIRFGPFFFLICGRTYSAGDTILSPVGSEIYRVNGDKTFRLDGHIESGFNNRKVVTTLEPLQWFIPGQDNFFVYFKDYANDWSSGYKSAEDLLANNLSAWYTDYEQNGCCTKMFILLQKNGEVLLLSTNTVPIGVTPTVSWGSKWIHK